LVVNFRLSVIVAELWRPEVARTILAFLEKNDPYGKIFKVLFRKFSPPHRSTLLCSNVVKFARQEIGEIVRYLSDQKIFGCLSNCRYCADRAQNLPGPAPNNVLSAHSHPNRFTFGGVSRTHERGFLLRIVFP